MTLLTGIRATGTQKFQALSSSGKSISFTLIYSAATQNWKADIEYNGFKLNGIRIFTSLNILYQYRNIIDFGLACYTQDKGEPFIVNDFSSGRAELYVLTADEVENVCEFCVEN